MATACATATKIRVARDVLSQPALQLGCCAWQLAHITPGPFTRLAARVERAFARKSLVRAGQQILMPAFEPVVTGPRFLQHVFEMSILQTLH